MSVLSNIYVFKVYALFLFTPQKNPQNYRPHPHLKLWGCLRVNPQKHQKSYAILNLKKPQNFWNVYPSTSPRKTSNFEDEVEDPQILRSRLAALLHSDSIAVTLILLRSDSSQTFDLTPAQFIVGFLAKKLTGVLRSCNITKPLHGYVLLSEAARDRL